jgi:hypothetical protein
LKNYLFLVSLTLAIFITYSLSPAAHADIITWTGAGDGINWSSPNNWNTHIVPTSNDNIVIENGTVDLDTDFTLTGSITMGSNGTLSVDSGKILTSSGTITNHCGLINNHGASISNSGIITNSYSNSGSCRFHSSEGTFSVPSILNSGTITNSGDIDNYIQIANFPTGTITNSGNIVTNAGGGTAIVNNGALTNSGTITISYGADLNQFGTLTNNSTGTIILALAAGISDGGTINNFGTIYVSSGSEITTSSFTQINNSGTIYNQGIILNTHQITNNLNGKIYSSGKIIENPGATIINYGTINAYCDAKISAQSTDTGKISNNPCLDATTTDVSLSPSFSSPGAQIKVTAKVTDTSGPANPTGTVIWSIDDRSEAGRFGSTSCHPSGDSILRCTVTYTSPNRTGYVTIIASYVPNNFNFTSSYGQGVLSIPLPPQPPTLPNPVPVNQTILMSDVNKWVGNSSSSINDEQLLSDVGISGANIPSWFKKVAIWFVDEETSPQEFVDALKYMHEKGIIISEKNQNSSNIFSFNGVMNPTISPIKSGEIKIISVGMSPIPLKVGDSPGFQLTYQNISGLPFYVAGGCRATSLFYTLSPTDNVREAPGANLMCADFSERVDPGKSVTSYARSSHLGGYYTILKPGMLNVTLDLHLSDSLNGGYVASTIQFNVNAISSSPTIIQNGTLSGNVTIEGGPACNPSRGNCDLSVNHEIDVYAIDGITIVGKTFSDSNAHYSIQLPAGNYIVYTYPIPKKIPHPISIIAGKNTIFDIAYDSGIR